MRARGCTGVARNRAKRAVTRPSVSRGGVMIVRMQLRSGREGGRGHRWCSQGALKPDGRF